MKLVIISDTHGQIEKVKIPKGDLLIHCGDSLNSGNVDELLRFNTSLQKLKTKFTHGIIYIPGNHDRIFQTNPEFALNIVKENCKVLIHDSYEIEDIKFFGSAWQPEFGHWAFGLPRGGALKEKWNQIPEDTQMLITHSPPYKILDKIPKEYLRFNEEINVGCKDLKERLKDLKQLRLHCFGHIHNSRGRSRIGKITFINASICTEQYKPINEVFEYEYISTK